MEDDNAPLYMSCLVPVELSDGEVKSYVIEYLYGDIPSHEEYHEEYIVNFLDNIMLAE